MISKMIFPIPNQRFILAEAAELYSLEELKKIKYRGQVPVALLLPRYFINNGKLEAIQESFADIDNWFFVPLKSDSYWGVWVSNSNAGR